MSDSRTILQLIRGKGAHADSIACVEGVPMQIAVRKADGFPHTIFQLVWHINYWMEYDLDRIAGKSREYPEHAAESWPENPSSGNQDLWEQEVRRFKSLLEQYEAHARAGEASLNRTLSATDPLMADRPYSIESILWQTILHNSYHVGQIAMLRQMFGLWPPPSGSDTW
jgi:uncharacterized damage-inducible protein DinB